MTHSDSAIRLPLSVRFVVCVSLFHLSLFVSLILQRGGAVENNAGSISSGGGTSTCLPARYPPKDQLTDRSHENIVPHLTHTHEVCDPVNWCHWAIAHCHLWSRGLKKKQKKHQRRLIPFWLSAGDKRRGTSEGKGLGSDKKKKSAFRRELC